MTDLLKEGWAQAGAVGVLVVAMGIVIWRQYVDAKAERKRNDDFAERVLTVAVESKEAIKADTEAKRGLIERLDRQVRP